MDAEFAYTPTMVCDTCGATLIVGDWPYCPHGKGTQAVHGDDIPGGQWFENGFETPRKFYAKSEHEAALKAEGCEIRAKWAGPGDKHLRRWDVPSQWQLEAAKALLSRPRSRPTQTDDDREFPDPRPEGEITRRDTGQTFVVRR